MVGARFKRNGKVPTEECRSDLGNQFFAHIGVVAKAFAEIAVAAMRW